MPQNLINLQETPETLEIVAAMGSERPEISRPAQEAFAAAVPPLLSQVLSVAGTASLIYQDHQFSDNDPRTIPLDDFTDVKQDYLHTWFAPQVIGHLATQEVAGAGEMRFTTYQLESAVSITKKYARARAAMGTLTKALNRMAEQILVKQELQAWIVLLKALGESRHVVRGSTVNSFTAAGTAGVLKLGDINNLITLSKKFNQSWAGTTPVSPYSKGLTDVFCSYEAKGDIRAFAYNPMNDSAVPNTDESTAVPLPDSIREEIYRNAGASSLFGINFTDLAELGPDAIYNTLFAAYAPANIAPGGGNFSASGNEVLIGFDDSKAEFIRPVRTDSDISSSVQVFVDEQWTNRSKKLGWSSEIEEGRICVGARSIQGLIL